MRAALQGRVYDVIGDLLTLNGIDFERLVKDTLLNPNRINAAKAQINRMTAEKYQEYRQATGIALARRHVDMEWVRNVTSPAKNAASCRNTSRRTSSTRPNKSGCGSNAAPTRCCGSSMSRSRCAATT